MAIIIEDGSIVTNSNSYITVAELDTYASDRGVTILAADTAAKEDLLIEAMDYLESLAFKGNKQTRDQSLVWPRFNVVVDGFWLDSTLIPDLLKDGQAEIALAVDRSQSPISDVARKTQSVGAGSVSVTYASGSASTTIVRTINAKLNKLLTTNGGNNFIVSRG